MEFILDQNQFNIQMNRLEKLLKETENQMGRKLEVEELFQWINRAKKQFSDLLDILDQSFIIAVTEVSGRIIYVNKKFCEISKYNENELVGKTHRVVRSGYHDKAFYKNMWDTILQGKVWEGNIKNRAKDGTYYWVNSVIVPILDEKNKPRLFVAFRKDITKSKELEERMLKELEKDYNLVLKNMHNYVFQALQDPSGRFYFQYGEGKLGHDLGLNTDNILDRSLNDIFDTATAQELEEKFRRAIAGETVTFPFDYKERHLLTTITPVSVDGKITSIIGNMNDVTGLYEANQEIEYLAYHDTLTGLPNQRKFREQIARLIHKKEKFALFIMDVDNFKRINDYFGHNIGDQLLRMLSNRLEKFISKLGNGTIYRYSGDEFIILVSEQTDKSFLIDYANGILNCLKEKFQISPTVDAYVTLSMGISLFPEHGSDEDSLIKSADRAMYASKRSQDCSFRFYDLELDQIYQKNIQIEQALSTVNMDEEFELYFQPKMDARTHEIRGMEALIRWHHPTMGNIPPNVFIKIAEESGNIIKIDDWVLKEACKTLKEWNKGCKEKPYHVAVNISAVHFSHPNFVFTVQSVLEETGLEPQFLEIEITETTLITNPETTNKHIQKLRDLGITVSIDDFGTGFTSLNYIRDFSFDMIKIDRSYISEMVDKKENGIIVKTIINLAHELQIKVVAEGVEDERVFQTLKEMECDEIQGYLISKPLPKEEIEKLLV